MNKFIKIPVIFGIEDKDVDLNDLSTYYVETEFLLNVEKIESVYFLKDENITVINFTSGDYYWTYYSVDQLMSLFNGEKSNIDNLIGVYKNE